ncbi:HET domain-containing protein [Colletotrichum chrysophilum]|uniref:HET domain-containing protein n=1 Tax=Colletotrichum chrysophilum TaxID=1836956 RepID=A0AAD9EFE0_9PEZI|nr:HET domain-containing protein [Colletotrichum chrysophilum]
MSPISTYQYPPLSGPRFTRLIRLHPGTTKSPSCPLSCNLDEINLDNPPDYFALSYTWNGETPSEPLTIGNAQVDTSQTSGSRLLITPNCAAALRVFRKSLHRLINRRKSVTLWVDAICIDQSSNDDKSTQVAMMAEIFHRAKRVAVCLGDRRAPLTSRTLLGSLPCALLPNLDMGSLSGLFDWAERSKALRWFEPQVKRLEKLVGNVLCNFCCSETTLLAILWSSYWSRAWTIQEFANTRVSILCQNSNMISFVGMIKMIRHSSHFSQNGGQLLMHRDVHGRCRVFGHFSHDPLLISHYYLQRFLKLHVTEPRDRIFAFRAISTDVFAKIKVDYQRPLHDLYIETSMIVLKETKRLYLLYLASLARTSLEVTEIGSMPSWSVDFGTKDCHQFNRRAHMDPYLSSNASRGSPPLMSFLDVGGCLRVRGRSVGVIGNLISNIDPVGNFWLMAKMAREDASACGQEFHDDDIFSVSETDIKYENRLRQLMGDFVSFLHGKLGTDLLSEAKVAATLFELLDGIIDTKRHGRKPLPPLKPNATLHDLLEILCRNEKTGIDVKWAIGEGRMFFSIDGRAGLGVPWILEDDQIFVIAGLKHPFVLRPHGDNGEYRLVGPSVVTGMMKGELWPEDESELRDIDIV